MFGHLENFLKRISVLLIAICILVTIGGNFVHAQEEEKSIVRLIPEKSVILDTTAELEVKVSFSDTSIYNKQIYLSFHILDSDGEMLQYETARYLISLDDKGEATIPIQIDLNDYAEGRNELEIELDVVDEQNLYWFLDRDSVQVESVRVRCLLSGWERLYESLKSEILDSPAIFCANVVVFLLFCVVFFKIRRKNEI